MSARGENATIVSRQELHADLFILKIKYDNQSIPEFKPGQFTSLGFVREDSTPERIKLLRRAYSIASAPREKDALEFFIVKVDDGKLTPRLLGLPVGARLWMDEKIQGHFTLDPVPDGQDLVMVSTGTGLAPFISMLREYRDTGRWRKLIMINGVRVARDLGYVDELNAEMQRDPNFAYIPMVTRQPDWGGREGRVNRLFEDDVLEREFGVTLNPASCRVFLCGNPEMIKTVQAALEPRGFREYSERKCPEGTIHFERYW